MTVLLLLGGLLLGGVPATASATAPAAVSSGPWGSSKATGAHTSAASAPRNPVKKSSSVTRSKPKKSKKKKSGSLGVLGWILILFVVVVVLVVAGLFRGRRKS
ncbi:hypothetical protein V2W30_22335 [Streptomyces sp. Q6]|uniref:Uncharacterized protein n=1 Tax=Streptomyces citrinus TaxID=3118173 RepID=A0ACD5AEX8_9ACTN